MIATLHYVVQCIYKICMVHALYWIGLVPVKLTHFTRFANKKDQEEIDHKAVGPTLA